MTRNSSNVLTPGTNSDSSATRPANRGLPPGSTTTGTTAPIRPLIAIARAVPSATRPDSVPCTSAGNSSGATSSNRSKWSTLARRSPSLTDRSVDRCADQLRQRRLRHRRDARRIAEDAFEEGLAVQHPPVVQVTEVDLARSVRRSRSAEIPSVTHGTSNPARSATVGSRSTCCQLRSSTTPALLPGRLDEQRHPRQLGRRPARPDPAPGRRRPG